MKLFSPLKILCNKVKSWILNLNSYRNTHYRVLNTCKINYKKYMEKQIKKLPYMEKIVCVYTAYNGTKRSFDLGNVCSVHEKFFEDAMVELGKLPDDNVNHIPLVLFIYGGLDKDNPRVDIDVQELNKESIDNIVNLLYNKFGGK